MVYILMTDNSTGRVAIYEENGTSGTASNPNASRNAPLNSPNLHLDKIRFHSDFDYYLLESGPTTVTLTHPAVAGSTTQVAESPIITKIGQSSSTNQTLVTHGLGYVPSFMVVSNDGLLGPGTPIQDRSDGGFRMVTPYANTSIIGLRVTGYSTATGLSAINRNYKVIVFKAPVTDSPYLIDYINSTDRLILGKGKFRGALKALRVSKSADSSPFDIPLGKTIDIKNGGWKAVIADGTTYTHPDYDGSFTGSASIECSVE